MTIFIKCLDNTWPEWHSIWMLNEVVEQMQVEEEMQISRIRIGQVTDKARHEEVKTEQFGETITLVSVP